MIKTNKQKIINLINTLKKYDGKNIIIDNPEKNISIYEYLDVVDILLTYGSTTLVDFSLLGVPIIDSDLNKLQYPMRAWF